MLAFDIIIATVFAVACNALALGGSAPAVKTHSIACGIGQPINATTITLSNGAKLQSWGCAQSVTVKAQFAQDSSDFKLGTYDTTGHSVSETSLTTRQYNACGVNCTTYCYNSPGWGPDPNDCSALASGWTDGTFYVEPGVTWYFWLASCRVSIANRQSGGTLTYCWNDLHGVTNYIAWNCQATQSAHGGYCLMNNRFDIGSIAVDRRSL